MSEPTSQKHGQLGEEAAADYYCQQGYTIIARNVREAHNEIDLIVENEESLVFVEVKTRTQAPGTPNRYGRPASAVDSGKRQRTVLAAEAYLRAHPTGKQPRIDVVEVYLRRSANGQVHICALIPFRNAFGAR